MHENDIYEIKTLLRNTKTVEDKEKTTKEIEEEYIDEFTFSRKYSKTWSMPQE